MVLIHVRQHALGVELALRAGVPAFATLDALALDDRDVGPGRVAFRIVAPPALSGQPFRNTVVRIPGPSWIEYFWMLKISPVYMLDRKDGSLSHVV